MRLMIVLFLTLSIWGCKRKTADTNLKTESRLKAAMQNELYKAVNYDSAKVKYQVLDVTFYEEKNRFVCEFNVRLVQNGHDTTGIMTADISRDMTVVKRKS